MTIVGSRVLSRPGSQFAREAGRAVAQSGGVVVSGGAQGADREAALGAAKWAKEAGVPVPVVELLPCGLGRWDRRPTGVAIALAGPEEGFSSALAMERNALLYAFSDRSLVVAARFREGGTWTGASDALRRRLSTLFVRSDGSEAAKALQNLGATPVRDPKAFISLEVDPRMGLFS